MLSIFCSFSRSLYINYTRSGFIKAINASDEVPVFALFYLKQEPRSTRVIPRFQEIIQKTEEKVVGVAIECVSEFGTCAEYDAKIFPSILAIRSTDRFYQKLYAGNFTEPSIKSFIKTITNPKIVQIEDLTVTDSFVDPSNDMSFPLLINAGQNHGTEKELTKQIASYSAAANRTLYTYDGGSQKPSLRVFVGPNCDVEYTGDLNKEEALKFLEDNKFNIYHKFKYEEFATYHLEKPMLLVVSFKGLTEEYSTILSDVSGKLCQKFIFGWVDPFSDRRFNITFKQDPEDPTVFAYVDRTEHKVFKLLKKPCSQLVHQFVLNVTHYYEKGGDWDNGWPVFTAFALIIILSIFLIGCNNAYQSCIHAINEMCF